MLNQICTCYLNLQKIIITPFKAFKDFADSTKKRERNQQGCAPAFSYSVKTDYASVSSLAPSSPKSSTFFLLATMRS